ncbi:MAG: glycosyltransferase [Bacteroidota bacterium]
MKILLVSSSILPYAGGSSVIVENLAQNFDQSELIVVGGKDRFQPKAVSRNPQGPTFRYFFSEMSFFGRGARYFNWFRQLRFPVLVNHLKEIIQKEQIDHVIGVYPTHFYCLAACRAAQQSQKPFSSYFHNTYLENTAIKDPNAPSIQKEIFEMSQHIFVISKGMEDFYRHQYQLDKFTPLVHTFNQYPPTQQLSGLPGTQKKTYKLVAIGNFNESNMDATIRLARAIKDDDRFSLHVYTHVPKLLLQKRGLDPRWLVHEGFVTPDQVHEVLQAYDIAVLTHGFTGGYGAIEYQTIFPTRTIPLLLSGKPILAHSPKGSFLNQFIESNHCAALIDEADEKAIVKELEKIVRDQHYQQTLVDAAKQTSELFYGPNVVRTLKSKLAEKA